LFSLEELKMKRTVLKHGICCVSMAFLACCLAVSVAVGEVIGELKLDDLSRLGTVIESDVTSGVTSVSIEAKGPTTICLGELTGLQVDEAQLLYEARVRSALSEGVAYLEMWCHVAGGQYFSRGTNSVVQGKSDWKTLSTPFLLKKGQVADKVVLSVVIQGKGKIWLNDVKLLRKPID
jgi:hypothetical protein